jgi:predicted DsbA family dithiol-disulfide isomerase
MQVAPGTISVWSDLYCPWSHVALWRLWEARRRLGLTDRVRFDHRVFPLELFNSEPTPYRTIAAEVPVCASLAPRAGWQVWQAPLSEWPVTTLPAMEAVQAAKDQSLEASEELRHVVLEVANETGAVDVAALARALDEGRARRRIADDWAEARREGVRGSPHLYFPDGSDAHNPGVTFHWEGPHGIGFPVVDADDPGVFDALVRRAAGT